MKKLILAVLILGSTACSNISGGSYTEYKPFSAQPTTNCAVESSDIYLINGTPSLKYICNEVK